MCTRAIRWNVYNKTRSRWDLKKGVIFLKQNTSKGENFREKVTIAAATAAAAAAAAAAAPPRSSRPGWLLGCRVRWCIYITPPSGGFPSSIAHCSTSKRVPVPIPNDGTPSESSLSARCSQRRAIVAPAPFQLLWRCRPWNVCDIRRRVRYARRCGRSVQRTEGAERSRDGYHDAAWCALDC